MDRLTGLQAFGGVVECGGFSAAARRLDMSVTMVSNHVHALETRLGVRLLNRTTRKVSLTEIGREYYERASRILAELEEADRLAAAQQVSPSGRLRLHASDNLVRFLAPVMAEYLAAYPAATIDLTVGDRLVDVVEEGYDLVVRTRAPPDSELIVRKLTPWRHVLCCAPPFLDRHPRPKRLPDLADLNCLQFPFYPYGNEWRFEGPDGEPASVRVSGNLMTSSAEALRLVATAGMGIVLAPAFLVSDDLAAGSLVTLLPGYRPVEFAINAIYPSRHHLSAKVRVFLDLLADRFASYREWLDIDRRP